GLVKVLTEGEGKHGCIIAPDGKTFLDTRSTPALPPVTALRHIDGTVLNETLLKADISQLQQVGYTAAEEFCVKAADNQTDLWGVMYKPHDFDPKKKYPVIEYIYGGPQIAVAEHSFPATFGLAAARWAQLGCISVMVDARGTPERSKAFHDACYGN